MYIFLSNHRISVGTALKMAGYRYREKANDWIRPDEQGRFHARKLEGKKVIDLHYDLTVEDHHFSPIMPIKHNEERKRILDRIRHLKMKDIDLAEEVQKL